MLHAAALLLHPELLLPAAAVATYINPPVNSIVCPPCIHLRSWLLSHTHVIVGWVFNITFSLALVYASTWLVSCGGSACQRLGALHASTPGGHRPGFMRAQWCGINALSSVLPTLPAAAVCRW